MVAMSTWCIAYDTYKCERNSGLKMRWNRLTFYSGELDAMWLVDRLMWHRDKHCGKNDEWSAPRIRHLQTTKVNKDKAENYTKQGMQLNPSSPAESNESHSASESPIFVAIFDQSACSYLFFF